MQIKHELPPIWNKVIEAGMKPQKESTIFTYGNIIYVPNKDLELPDHLIIHEETHCKQQGSTPDAWWERYITDPYFRIDQEIEAYANQYRFICKSHKDRNQRARILLELASIVAGPIYGKMIHYQDAFKMIKNKANVNF